MTFLMYYLKSLNKFGSLSQSLHCIYVQCLSSAGNCLSEPATGGVPQKRSKESIGREWLKKSSNVFKDSH